MNHPSQFGHQTGSEGSSSSGGYGAPPARRYSGEIRMTFVNRGGRTVADRTYRRGNSRISANIPTAGGIPYYFLISTGGGYTEGESYLQEITLGDSTHAILTTQTPNYIYKCDRGRETSQHNIVTVGNDALLEYYIDETIPYANAIFRQDTEIRLGAGASLIMTDGLTSGWSADETPFQYGRIMIRNVIEKERELLANDCLIVDPREEPMDEIGYFEGKRSFHSAMIIDNEINERAIRDMRAYMQGIPTPCRYGMTLLEKGGAVLRVLGDSAYENRKVLRKWIRYYREQIKGLSRLELRKTTQ